MKEFPINLGNDLVNVSSKKSSFVKILQNDCNNILLNTNISVENEQFFLKEINNPLEGDENTNDNINLENLQKVDFKKMFYIQPSQVALGRTEGNLALSSEFEKSK
jgi:hypothetical protein